MIGWEVFVGVAFLATGLAVTSRIMKSGYEPARSRLESGAGSQGLRVVSASPRLLWRGPFFFANGMQKIFRFAAMDSDAMTKRGWARCGWTFTSWKIGLTDQVVVKWD